MFSKKTLWISVIPSRYINTQDTFRCGHIWISFYHLSCFSSHLKLYARYVMTINEKCIKLTYVYFGNSAISRFQCNSTMQWQYQWMALNVGIQCNGNSTISALNSITISFQRISYFIWKEVIYNISWFTYDRTISALYYLYKTIYVGNLKIY